MGRRMYAYRSEPLTQEAATKACTEWIDNRIEKPTGKYPWSQMRWLLRQLGALCGKEAVAKNEDEDALYQRLSDAYDIVHSAWYAAALKIATKLWLPDEKTKP